MEAGIATERAKEGRQERFQSAGGELAGLAIRREHRAGHAASTIGPVITVAAAEQLEEMRRPVPPEAAENGMGI